MSKYKILNLYACLGKIQHSEATGLCPDRFKHFEAK